MHGHSSKKGCFFYGPTPFSIPRALFPKLCSMASSDYSFQHCHWRRQKGHQNAARCVVQDELHVEQSFTMECSMSAPDEKPERTWMATDMAISCFVPLRVELLGAVLGHAASLFLIDKN